MHHDHDLGHDGLVLVSFGGLRAITGVMGDHGRDNPCDGRIIFFFPCLELMTPLIMSIMEGVIISFSFFSL